MKHLAATVLLLVAVSGWAQPLHDHAGQDRPRRVVSLDLCTDRLLAHHGARAQTTALSPLSRNHARTAGWPAHDGSLEGILALRPDLVVTGEFNALLLRRRLAALGVRVEVLPLPTRLMDVPVYEKRFLELMGLSESLATEPSTPAAAGTGKRLLVLGANGIGTGLATMEHDVLQRAGWRNWLQSEGFVRLDLERIVADAPDAVLRAAPASPALAQRFAEHPALVQAVPPSRWLVTDVWQWECPGPWTWNLVRALNAALKTVQP